MVLLLLLLLQTNYYNNDNANNDDDNNTTPSPPTKSLDFRGFVSSRLLNLRIGILMSVESYRESPGKFDSRTLSTKTLNRWTGRTARYHTCIMYTIPHIIYNHIPHNIYIYIYIHIYIYIYIYMYHMAEIFPVLFDCSKRSAQQPPNPVHFMSIHYITLHYITLHYITLHYIGLTEFNLK